MTGVFGELFKSLMHMVQILFNLCTIKGIDQTAQMVKHFVASIR